MARIKSKKVATVEDSEASVAEKHQLEPAHSADIGALFALEMEKEAPASIA